MIFQTSMIMFHVNLPRCSLVHRSQFLFRILHTSKTSLQAAGLTMSTTPPKTNGWNLKITTVWVQEHHLNQSIIFFGGVQVQNLSFQWVLCKTWICFFGWFLLRIGISWDENHHPNTTIWDFLFLGSFFKIGMFRSQSQEKGNGLLENRILPTNMVSMEVTKFTNYLVSWFIICNLFAGIPTYPFTKSDGHPSRKRLALLWGSSHLVSG